MGKRKRSILSIILTILLVVNLLPADALAAGDNKFMSNCREITSLEELTSGEYILSADGYSPTKIVNGWLNVQETSSVRTTEAVLRLTVNEDKTVKLQDSAEQYMAPKGGNANGIKSSEYNWQVECKDGKFAFKGVGGDTVTLACNKDYDYKIKAYKNATAFDADGQPKSDYPSQFTLYQYVASDDEQVEIPDEEDKPQADVLKTGDQVVIYAPAYNRALSSQYSGFYNNATDIAVQNDTMTGFTASDVWKVEAHGNNTYSFSFENKNLAMGDKYTSTPLGEKNDKWVITACEDGTYNVKNVERNCYLEYQTAKETWSAYGTISKDSYDMFALKFFKVTEMPQVQPEQGLPNAGDQVVIYNVSAQGALAGQDDNVDSPSIYNASAQIENSQVIASNGTRIFTVEKNGEYFRFKTENDGYLCSNGTGKNAFYKKEASEEADWTLAAYNGGFSLESRTAKFNDKYSQFLEYFSEAYMTYSKNNETDKDIYTFKFYPCGNNAETIVDGVVNEPKINFSPSLQAAVHKEFKLSFTVDAVFKVAGELTASLDGEELSVMAPSENEENYTVIIPAEKVTGNQLTVTVEGKDTKGKAISGSAEIDVIDVPLITKVTPEEGSQAQDNKKTEIAVEFENAGIAPTADVTVKSGANTIVSNQAMTVNENTASYLLDVGLADGRYNVTVSLTRADGKNAVKTWSFVVGEMSSQLYFGQLHSHTTYSDGSGSLDAALEYVKNLPDSANVDFVAFTDHSNYFDEKSAANPEQALYDMNAATAVSQQTWNSYKTTIDEFNANNTDIVAIGGFEMTWSGGPGHINTFNTPGIVSRNNTTLNNKTDNAGLKAYYNLLSQPEGESALVQLNHPGSTFGTFADFAYWDAVIDTRVFLVEVGNGEGAIGSGGYFPSYEYYTMALDKGWHVAPTNNQDNHKGKWGNANDARDVILTDDFSEQGIYNAIRERHVYATEDKNLEVYYTLNGEQLGTIIQEKPETAEINVEVNDPDASDKISKVEVIVNSGKVAYTWNDPAELSAGILSCRLDVPESVSYYYIRVTQEDGDLAVTAPVWVGETMKIGISSLECSTSTPVTGEELTLTTTLFNSENKDVKVKKMTYMVNGSQILGTDSQEKTISASSSLNANYSFTPEQAKVTTITVQAVVDVNGEELIFTKDITLQIEEASKLAYIGIDASHFNEYVNGNYKDSMGNLGKLAAGYNVRTVQLSTSEDLIRACENAEGKYKALVLTVPSRRNGTALRDPYANYTDAEIEAIKAFNKAGGTLIVAGWSDNYENYGSFKAEDHMAAQQNKLLEALGSSLRIGDDAAYDDSLNGGQSYRLYFSTYNFDSFLMEGVEYDEAHPNDKIYSQVFSQYGGASIYTVDGQGNASSQIPETVTPVVYGHATTYSKDTDKDGLGGSDIPKYPASLGDDRLLILASEQLEGQGMIVVSGAAFMSNFEVQVTVEDSNAEKNYSNYNICENLVKFINPVDVSPVIKAQTEESEGVKYTVEGIVTSNASGYDKNTAFFDCIYIQDDTAGINCFPVAGEFKIGDKVRITGTTSSYQGERQLAVTNIEKVGEAAAVAPEVVTAKKINDGSVLGKLISLSGKIETVKEENGLIQTIMVKDAAGDIARVFIDGYITTSYDVEKAEVGNEITVIGLASYDNSFDGIAPRIRVRDRNDITCTKPSGASNDHSDNSSSDDDLSNDSSSSSQSSNHHSSSSNTAQQPAKDEFISEVKVETQSKLEVSVAKVDAKVADAVKKYKDENTEIISTTGIAIESKDFNEPAVLTIPVKQMTLKDGQQLSIVKASLNEKGEAVIKAFGGHYDAEKGKVSAYVNESGSYYIAKTQGLNMIELIISQSDSIINQQVCKLDAIPVITEDRTMVPLRFIAEAFKAEVKWENKTKTVNINADGKQLTMTIGKKIEGFDTAPIIMNGRTMVPIRYISEALGANVIWVPSVQKIVIVK